MALIGIEYLDRFADARAAAGITGGEDLSSPYYIANWLGPTLADGGHTVKFLRNNHQVAERHMRDASQQGDDAQHADSVDLYFIMTHGHYKDGECKLLYDNQVDHWVGESKTWRFGDGCNMEWLMICGCRSIDANNVLQHLDVFQRLHLFCGAYGDMIDSFTIDEAGSDIANNLLNGYTVCDAWGEGLEDWWANNHQMVLSVELQWTYNNGDVLWEETILGCDHLWGEGATLPDVKHNEIFWMASKSWDGGLYG